MSDSRKRQMRAGDPVAVLGRVREYLLALFRGCRQVEVVLEGHRRVGELRGGGMHEIAPQEQLLTAALHHIHSVAGGMSRGRDSAHARHKLDVTLERLEAAGRAVRRE